MARQFGSKNRRFQDGKYECKLCGNFKESSEFYPEKHAKCGLRSRCKKCDIQAINDRHTNNLDRALRNLVLHNKSNGKHGSKRRQEFSRESCVTPQILHDLWKQQDGKCAVTKVPLTHIQGAGRSVWTNVTVDRIDSEVGYEPGNVRLVSRAVNFMKNSMTDTEMVEWAKAIVNGPIGAGLLQCS